MLRTRKEARRSALRDPSQTKRLTMYRHLLIATDGSELSGEAVVQGLSLAKKLGAKVTAVVVTEPPALMVGGEAVHPQAIESNANSVLAPVREAAEKNGVAFEAIHAKNQNPAEGIIQTAQEKGCDLIVMTTHGRRLSRVLMGKQAMKVLTYSSIPVLVCR